MDNKTKFFGEFSKPTFKVNEYDHDGDCYEEGIYLCFGGVTIKVADTFNGWTGFVEWIESITEEIKEHTT